MVVETRFDFFAILVDPVSGLKIELSPSEDSEVHFRHLGFRAEDVDGTHESLVKAVWSPVRRPNGATSPACTRRSSSSRAASRSSS